MWPNLLAKHGNRRREDDIRDIENGENGIVLIALEMKVFLESICLGISQITFVESIAKIPSKLAISVVGLTLASKWNRHKGQDWQYPAVELPTKCTLSTMIEYLSCLTLCCGLDLPRMG